MPTKSINSGIALTVPTSGTTPWDTLFDTVLTAISGHTHEGSGAGLQLGTNAIQDNAITGGKIRLANAQWLRARNAANTADVNVLRLNSSDQIELNVQAVQQTTSDGADNSFVYVAGGGGSSSTRGASLTVYGNEHSTQAGDAILTAGDVTGGVVLLSAPNAGGGVFISTTGTNRWLVDSTGDLKPAANATYSFGISNQAPTRVYIATVASAPSTPSGSGVLYVDGSGILKYKGPGGTETNLAPA